MKKRNNETIIYKFGFFLFNACGRIHGMLMDHIGLDGSGEYNDEKHDLMKRSPSWWISGFADKSAKIEQWIDQNVTTDVHGCHWSKEVYEPINKARANRQKPVD